MNQYGLRHTYQVKMAFYLEILRRRGDNSLPFPREIIWHIARLAAPYIERFDKLDQRPARHFGTLDSITSRFWIYIRDLTGSNSHWNQDLDNRELTLTRPNTDIILLQIKLDYGDTFSVLDKYFVVTHEGQNFSAKVWAINELKNAHQLPPFYYIGKITPHYQRLPILTQTGVHLWNDDGESLYWPFAYEMDNPDQAEPNEEATPKFRFCAKKWEKQKVPHASNVRLGGTHTGNILLRNRGGPYRLYNLHTKVENTLHLIEDKVGSTMGHWLVRDTLFFRHISATGIWYFSSYNITTQKFILGVGSSATCGINPDGLQYSADLETAVILDMLTGKPHLILPSELRQRSERDKSGIINAAGYFDAKIITIQHTENCWYVVYL